jgi:hypothetical protein
MSGTLGSAWVLLAGVTPLLWSRLVTPRPLILRARLSLSLELA